MMHIEPRFGAIHVASFRRPDKFAPHFELNLKLTGKDRLQGAERTEFTRIKFEPGTETPFSVYAQASPEKPGNGVRKFSPHTLQLILNKLQTETLHFTREFRDLITKGRPAQMAGELAHQVELPEVTPIGIEAAAAEIRGIAKEMHQSLA